MKNNDHTLVLVTAGTMELTDPKGTMRFEAGDLCFCNARRLFSYRTLAPASGEYKQISIDLPLSVLENFAREYNYPETQCSTASAFLKLPESPLLLNYMKALLPYEEIFKHEQSKELRQVKVKEGILTLLMENPDMKDILFDFSKPEKTDLRQFMLQHYHFNADLQRFAYLTGRSLSTFKRDFERTFQMPPSRWLLQKRLEQAFYLIKKKRKSASAIYLDLGFEDLSHFSYAFKKHFGVAPSLL